MAGLLIWEDRAAEKAGYGHKMSTVKALFSICVDLCHWLCIFHMCAFASLEHVLSFAG